MPNHDLNTISSRYNSQFTTCSITCATHCTSTRTYNTAPVLNIARFGQPSAEAACGGFSRCVHPSGVARALVRFNQPYSFATTRQPIASEVVNLYGVCVCVRVQVVQQECVSSDRKQVELSLYPLNTHVKHETQLYFDDSTATADMSSLRIGCGYGIKRR